VIQLTRSGTVVSGPSSALETLRHDFARQHYVRLPGFLEPQLLRFIQSSVEHAEFEERVHLHAQHVPSAPDAQPWARDVTMKANLAQGLLDLLLMNDAVLFETIEFITAAERIGCFDGTVYRIDPASGHYDSWHDDVGHFRVAAISINLSAAPFTGGVLQIRNAATSEILSDVPNPCPGDAVLFRVSPQLQHRVGKVEGATARTVFAGWFCSEPVFDFRSAIKRD
jgi:hypothetical protein